MFFAELVLYTGSRLRSELVDTKASAFSICQAFSTRTMVEDAYVINCETGEVTNYIRTPAANWRGGEVEEEA